jgi:hypothetical protein
MSRFTLSLATVALVGLFTFPAAAAHAKGPGTAVRSTYAKNISRTPAAGLNFTATPTITNSRLLGGINRKPIAVFGNGLEWGHGPVVLPPKGTTPVTWGGNPPRAPSHGCEHHHHDHGWFVRYLCYLDFQSYLTDFDYDFDFCY